MCSFIPAEKSEFQIPQSQAGTDRQRLDAERALKAAQPF
jgi:hypothetical protein